MQLPQYFGGHDQAKRLWVDLHVSCNQSDISEGLLEVTEFLVGQSLYWACVYNPGHVLGSQGDRVLRYNRFA